MPYRSNSPINLVRVAEQQRLLLLLILCSILGTFGSMGVVIMGATNIPELLVILVMLGLLLIQILAIVQAFRLTRRMRASLLYPIIMLLGILMPLLGLIMLVIINNKANVLLKGAGVRVGLMGVPKSEYFKLMPGHCHMCGYDRHGLSLAGACPECGCIPTGEPAYRAQ